jgi:hypothetical protein
MSTPAWQHEIPIEELRRLAAPFKASNAAHVFGAFGLVKERDVAAALAEQRCSWINAGAAAAVVAFSRVLKSASHATDFRGEPIVIPAGDLLVGDLGWALPPEDLAAPVAKLLDALWSRSGAPVQWVEWFAEDVPLREALRDLGFVILARKVMAGSEIKHVGCRAHDGAELAARARRCCPATLPHDLLTLGVLRPEALAVEAHETILGELHAFEAAAAGAAWLQHYSSYNKRESWTAFALRGFDAADPGFIIKPGEMSKKWKAEHPQRLHARAAWTIAASAFPRTLAILRLLLGERTPERARFMKLAPGGGELTRHADITDREAGTRDGALVRLHFPLITHEAVRFSAWNLSGERLDRYLPPRALCYLDQRKPHTVVNGSPIERVHLVCDVPSDAALRGILSAAVED